MNILLDPLPEAVEIDGQEFPIHTDFRDCLRVILAFEDPGLTVGEKQAVLLTNLYPTPPANLVKAFEMGIRFLNGGEHVQTEGEAEKEGALRLYSFNQDANLIFAAFRQTHGIDLEAVDHFHWWKFLALFMDLGSETTFCNLISLRKRVKTGKATKEEKQAYRELGDVAELEDPEQLTDEDRACEAEFLRLVEEGRRDRAQEITG